MKFSKEAFDLVIKAPQYEGALAYLIDDNNNKVTYQIYVCVVESGNVATIMCEKDPITKDPNNFELFEFNGNKLLEHNVVRIKKLDSTTPRAQKLLTSFKEKKLFYNNVN